MNLTDYVVVLLQTCLPLDTIRIIMSYVRLPLMQQANRMFLDRFMEERRIKFRLNELPYQVFSINDVYNHLQLSVHTNYSLYYVKLYYNNIFTPKSIKIVIKFISYSCYFY